MVDINFTAQDDGCINEGGYLNSTIYFKTLANDFLRFSSVNIPKGSIITDVSLQIHVDGWQSYGCYAKFYLRFEDAGNASAIGSTSDFNSRSYTSAYTDNTITSIYGVGWQTFDGFEAALQEVIDRSDWASGNAVQILCYGHSGGTGWVESSVHTAKLYITYTTPTGGQVRVIGMMM